VTLGISLCQFFFFPLNQRIHDGVLFLFGRVSERRRASSAGRSRTTELIGIRLVSLSRFGITNLFMSCRCARFVVARQKLKLYVPGSRVKPVWY